MKNTIGYIIIGVCLAIGIIIGLRGCESKPGPDHTSDKKFSDSLASVLKDHDAQTQRIVDSLKKHSDSLQNDKDSLVAIVVSYEKNLAKQSGDISSLIAELNDAEIQRDTLKALNKCDSLKDAFLNAKAVVGAYIFSNDSLRKLNDDIIAAKTEIGNRLNNQLMECNNGFFAMQLKYQRLYSDYQRINKPKRFGIGPAAGAFITNKGLGYGVGFTIHYDLIKF